MKTEYVIKVGEFVALALALWLTDRSRYEAGTGHCRRARFLSNHAGPNGYGWARKAQSVPLVTGTMVAGVQEKLHRAVMATGHIPKDAEIQGWLAEAVAEYLKIVETRGLTHIVDPTELDKRVREQTTLLESLVWLWVDIGLPRLLAEWTIILVESEGVSILGCTCGLGDRLGTAEQHDARQCQGIGYMTRGDLVTQNLTNPERFAYHEFKSPGETTMNTDAAWQYRVQLISGVMGAEDQIGHQIDEVYLHQLVKGKRQSEWDYALKAAVGPKFQNSPLVYGWKRPANPPLLPEDWADSYDYVDETGKNRKLSKDYSRTGIWELRPEGDLSPACYWGRWMSQELRASKYRMLGPLMRDKVRLGEYTRQLIGEEQRWQAITWELFESGKVWGEPEFMALLDKLVPQTRGEACHSYYGEPCFALPLCDRVAGWESPEGIGYVPRTPHHTPELEQARERGLLPPAEGLAESGGDD